MRGPKALAALTMIIVLVFAISVYAMPTLPTMVDTDKIKVGAWVKYLQSSGKAKMTIWIGAVGEQTINGKRYVWMEMHNTIKNQKIISKMLMRYSLMKNITEIKRIIFKQDGKPAMELPPEMVTMAGSMITPVSPTKGKKSKIEDLGTQTINVPAGTFHTKHIKVIEIDKPSNYLEVWQSDKVPLGIVKVRTSEGYLLTLLDYGSNARSAIIEKPKMLNIPVKIQ